MWKRKRMQFCEGKNTVNPFNSADLLVAAPLVSVLIIFAKVLFFLPFMFIIIEFSYINKRDRKSVV